MSGREMISLLPPFPGSPAMVRTMWVMSFTLLLDVCSFHRKWHTRGWALLTSSPSASLCAPIACYTSQIDFCCSQCASSELHIAKKPFKSDFSLLVVFTLILNDKYFIKCLPSSLCSSVLSSALQFSMCTALNRFI